MPGNERERVRDVKWDVSSTCLPGVVMTMIDSVLRRSAQNLPKVACAWSSAYLPPLISPVPKDQALLGQSWAFCKPWKRRADVPGSRPSPNLQIAKPIQLQVIELQEAPTSRLTH